MLGVLILDVVVRPIAQCWPLQVLLESRRNDYEEDDGGAMGLHECFGSRPRTNEGSQGRDLRSTMDTNKIEPFYSKAPENIFFDVAPMQFKGWEEWAKGAQNLFSDYKSFKLRLATEPIIHNEGNWAWGTYLWRVDAVHKDGKTETLDGRDTAIWQKQGNRWLTVHEHVSIPMSMPATGNK